MEGAGPLEHIPAQREELSQQEMLCSFSSLHGAWRTQETEVAFTDERSEGSRSNVSTETKTVLEMQPTMVTKEPGLGNCFVEDDPGKYAFSIRPHLGLDQYVNIYRH